MNLQELVRQKPGVLETRVGFFGGKLSKPSSRDPRDHASAVEILFDPHVVSYRDLLAFYFQIHDPTTEDPCEVIGPAIFTTTEAQETIAHEVIRDVEAAGLWPGKVVTRVIPAAPTDHFWEADAFVQHYLQRFPEQCTCSYLPTEWELPARP